MFYENNWIHPLKLTEDEDYIESMIYSKVSLIIEVD